MSTLPRGTTIVELTVATVILAVVFATIMPVFAAMRNQTEAAAAKSEMVQNARVLNDQLYRCLAQAGRITAVSGSTETEGFVEFEGGDATIHRCGLGTDGCIEFGPVDDLCDLAGPVEYLTFVCYDSNDPMVRTVVPEHIRLVTWEARLKSAGTLTGDKTIRGACYLRVNGNVGIEEAATTYDFATGRQGVDCFAFAGEGNTQTPAAPDTPSDALGPGHYDAIEAQDGAFHEVAVSTEGDYAQVRFTFQITEDGSDVSRITATWRGRGVNGHPGRSDGASLYAWNYASAGYELLQASPDMDAEVTLTGSRIDASAQYVGGSGGKTVVLLVASNDGKKGQEVNSLLTDYVRLDIAVPDTTGLLP